MREHTFRTILYLVPLGLLGAAALPPACQATPDSPTPGTFRELPQPSRRALDPKSPGRFVDANKGDDKAAGTEAAPWKTLRHAVGKLQPGQTLYLRGGVYYERVSLSISGTPEKPITIRSYPGELAIVDGGFREFAESPTKAWEPVPGSAGEYRSTGTYPELAEDTRSVSWQENNPDHPRLHVGPAPKEDERGVVRGIYGSGYFSCVVKVLGNFADTMVPLHGYYNRSDLPEEDPQVKRRPAEHHGPGVWFDMKTQRVHARLAPTEFAHLGDANYRGESDPRKVPLVIGGSRVVLHIENAKYLRIEELVVRGTRSRTVNVEKSMDILLDHVALYGGAPALQIESTVGFRLVHSALRGLCAPWSSRSSEKYHGISCYLFIADGTAPLNREVEIANCELTDNHDGLVVGSIEGLRFHHNLVDHFNDDGLYLTTDMPAGGNQHYYQNFLARSLSMLAYSGAGTDQKGKEANFYRNVFDLRAGIHSPTGWTASRTCGDHGSPIWKPMRFYHNTVLQPETPWRNYYAAGLSKAVKDSSRSLLNNVIYQTKGVPGFAFDLPGEQVYDGNLHWSDEVPEKERGEFLTKARIPRPKMPNWFEESKKTYAPGWTGHDVFADPLFVKLGNEGPCDLRLREQSPAIDAGVAIPRDWPDPLRDEDRGKPDIGAFPAGSKGWTIGVDGRYTAHGSRVR